MRREVDRREEYYQRAADLMAADPLWFYARAEHGRRVQAGIKPKDLQPFAAVSAAPPAVDNVVQHPSAKKVRRG